ncbi:MAG: hypothetical protein WC071_08925, partial [Victivallaceae bacterium]
SCQSTIMLSAKTAHELIERKTLEAISKIQKIKPPKIDLPVTLRVEKIERGTIPRRANIKLIDGRTYESSSDISVEDAFWKSLG